MNKKIVLSKLSHTWIIDLDGTIVKHNGYKIDGEDSFVDGAEEFLKNIPQNDMIIFLTSRKEKYRLLTEKFLKDNNVKYDYIIFDSPYGERILINDDKPSGLKMSLSLNLERDSGIDFEVIEDDNL